MPSNRTEKTKTAYEIMLSCSAADKKTENSNKCKLEVGFHNSLGRFLFGCVKIYHINCKLLLTVKFLIKKV